MLIKFNNYKITILIKYNIYVTIVISSDAKHASMRYTILFKGYYVSKIEFQL